MDINGSAAVAVVGANAGRARSVGFKVDVSRGERFGRVSSEWFSRPDDERYLSLPELHDAVGPERSAPRRGPWRAGPSGWKRAATMPSA